MFTELYSTQNFNFTNLSSNPVSPPPAFAPFGRLLDEVEECGVALAVERAQVSEEREITGQC